MGLVLAEGFRAMWKPACCGRWSWRRWTVAALAVLLVIIAGRYVSRSNSLRGEFGRAITTPLATAAADHSTLNTFQAAVTWEYSVAHAWYLRLRRRDGTIVEADDSGLAALSGTFVLRDQAGGIRAEGAIWPPGKGIVGRQESVGRMLASPQSGDRLQVRLEQGETMRRGERLTLELMCELCGCEAVGHLWMGTLALVSASASVALAAIVVFGRRSGP